MRLGLRNASLLACGALAGCLTTNPALTDSNGDGGDDDTSSSGGTSGSPTTSDPATSNGPTSDATSQGPTTDPGTTEDPTSDTEPGTTETTGPSACGADSVCVDAAPAGWSGPVIWAETPVGDEAPACPAAYPDPAFTAFDDLQAPPAECDCSCGAASGVSCGSITLEYHGSDSNCLTPDIEFPISSGACNDDPNQSSGRYWEVPQPGVTGGSCTPAGTTDVAEASWVNRSSVCGGATENPGRCGGGELCIPSPADGFESRICVWQPGSLECPAGSFSDRFVRHAEVDDTRACAACTCGSPTGECDGGIRLWTTENCATTSAGLISLGEGCTQGVAGAVPRSANQFNVAVADASCEPSVGTPIGEAEPDDPYTLCCMTVE